MDARLSGSIKRGTAYLIFAAICFAFYAIFYVNHLHFGEQYQMFVYNSQYLCEHLATPGGFADYFAEFVVQFAYIGWLGALFIAIVLLVLQRTIYLYQKGNELFFLLSFFPSVGYMAMLNSDIYNTLSAPISLIIVLCAGLVYRKISNIQIRAIAAICLAPLLFWTAGATSWIFPVLILSIEKLDFRTSWRQTLMLSIASLAAVVVTLFAIRAFMQYPLVKLARGLHYNKITIATPWIHIVTMAIAAAIIVLRQFVAATIGTIKFAASAMAVIAVELLALHYTYNAGEEEFMEYDYLLRNGQWSKIIEKADAKTPSYPLSISALNLALAKNGDLLDRMFCYRQAGELGLLPQFTRESTTELTASEVYFHLGMINIAQRFATETQEGVPDYQRSARIYKLLAQTYLLNREYSISEKYLKALSQTLFYRKWANETMKALHNPKSIAENPEWNRSLQLRPTHNFLSSTPLQDMALLYQDNPSNKMARQYMLALPLVLKDLNTFVKYFDTASFKNSEHLPTSIQEALLVLWTQEGNTPQSAPWKLDAGLDTKVADFLAIKQTSISPKDALKKYSNTFWYYLLFQ